MFTNNSKYLLPTNRRAEKTVAKMVARFRSGDSTSIEDRLRIIYQECVHNVNSLTCMRILSGSGAEIIDLNRTISDRRREFTRLMSRHYLPPNTVLQFNTKTGQAELLYQGTKYNPLRINCRTII